MEEFINNILFKTDKNKNIKFCYNYGNPEEIIQYHLDYDYFIKKNYDDLINKKYYKDDILDDYFISRLNDFNHDESDVNFFL